jgi:hypothetical protein
VKLAAHRQLMMKLRTNEALYPLLHVPSYCAYGQTLLKIFGPLDIVYLNKAVGCVVSVRGNLEAFFFSLPFVFVVQF